MNIHLLLNDNCVGTNVEKHARVHDDDNDDEVMKS